MLPRTLAWAGLVFWVATGAAHAGPFLLPFKKAEPATHTVPVQLVAAEHREAVRQVLEKPTLQARSQAEQFPGKAEVYRYFLDHPDRAVTAWRRLGAQCVSIHSRGNQQFGWADEKGEAVWETVVREPDLRVWYAEGKVKPTPVTAPVPVRAVVVIRHGPAVTSEGTPALQQQTEIYVHTDSKTAAALTKMLGSSAQRVAEQGLGQFQFFFSGLCQYLNRHPEQTAVLLREEP